MVPACDAAVVAGSAAIVSTSARTWLSFLVVNRFIVFMVIHFIVVVAKERKNVRADYGVARADRPHNPKGIGRLPPGEW